MWDYQTKACVQTLEGHTNNVSAVVFHPELPIILTGSEDGCIKIWHATTYRCELPPLRAPPPPGRTTPAAA